MKHILILIFFLIMININDVDLRKQEYLYINADDMAIYYILLPLEKISNNFIQIDCCK